jgi:hypothetical protein
MNYFLRSREAKEVEKWRNPSPVRDSALSPLERGLGVCYSLRQGFICKIPGIFGNFSVLLNLQFGGGRVTMLPFQGARTIPFKAQGVALGWVI